MKLANCSRGDKSQTTTEGKKKEKHTLIAVLKWTEKSVHFQAKNLRQIRKYHSARELPVAVPLLAGTTRHWSRGCSLLIGNELRWVSSPESPWAGLFLWQDKKTQRQREQEEQNTTMQPAPLGSELPLLLEFIAFTLHWLPTSSPPVNTRLI